LFSPKQDCELLGEDKGMANKISGFVQEVQGELKKVAWSSREELITSTIVVIVATVLLAMFVGVCDFILSRIVAFFVH
jgi:preprotein translocase subunit SecE